MNETLKQFSEEVAKALKAKIESADFATFIEKVQKAAGDDRTFEVVMSTSDEDRQGDALDQSGWDFKYFDMNPVLLWAHNYSGFPIGVITDIRIDGDQAIATGKFAPAGMNPEADLACALYQEKILKAVSPGYIQNDDGTRELLEVSFCAVPAGRYALSLRQVHSLGVSTRELITKGFFFEEKRSIKKDADDDPVLGDPCELDDGTPGVLAEDSENPNRLICVPAEEGKSISNIKKNMDELDEILKAEHGRHRGEVLEHISDLADEAPTNEKATDDGKKPEDDGLDKTIQEFTEKMDAEQQQHLEKCMKAIDDAADKIDPEAKKSIDEFRKSIEGEHLEHVKCFDKAIEEFRTKSEAGETQKAIEEFRTKAEGELDRHEKAQMDLCEKEFGTEKAIVLEQKGAVAEEMAEDEERQQKYKRLDRAYSVFYAFTSAYMEDTTPVDDFEKLLDEAVALMKDIETKAYPKSTIRPLIGKAGRSISAKNKAKIEAITKAIEDYHAEHTADHEQFTNKAIAALKELMSSPPADEGKETDEEKSSRTPKPRSATSGAKTDTSGSLTELDAYLLTQRLARKIKTEAEGILRQVKKELKEKYPEGRS